LQNLKEASTDVPEYAIPKTHLDVPVLEFEEPTNVVVRHQRLRLSTRLVHQCFSLKVLQVNAIQQIRTSTFIPPFNGGPALPRFVVVPDPLFCVADRPQCERSQIAEECCPKLPQPNEDPAWRYHEFDKFVCLVQIILALDVIFVVATVLLELEDGGKVDARAMKRDDPDTEDLSDVDVED
jgi:hypothetical protein